VARELWGERKTLELQRNHFLDEKTLSKIFRGKVPFEVFYFCGVAGNFPFPRRAAFHPQKTSEYASLNYISDILMKILFLFFISITHFSFHSCEPPKTNFAQAREI